MLFAKSLSVALDEYKEIEHFYVAQDIQHIEQMVCEKGVDIVLMDINLGGLSGSDGLETADGLLKSHPDLKIIILTGYDLPVYRHEAKKIGARVFHGGVCFPSENSKIVIEELTSMEKKILQLISGGKKRKRVAQELYISERTLSNHLQHIFEKFEVTSAVEAVTKAIQLGYIPPIC